MKRGRISKTSDGIDYDAIAGRTEVFCKGGDDGDFGGEEIRGADNKAIYPGRTVRRQPYFSESLQVTVPTSWGKVKRLYRQVGKKNPGSECDVIVQTHNGHFYWADQCVRSSAGEAEEAEHQKLDWIKEQE